MNQTTDLIFFYRLFLLTYSAGIHIAAIWNIKARQWVIGRKDWKKNLGAGLKPGKTVWMHCASLGEFEQGRPVLDLIRKQFPSYNIVLTFFSPSGFEIRKNYKGANAVYYLPMDGKNHAAYFIEVIQPALVIWIKYEYWYHYLTHLNKMRVPILLVSGIFRPSQPFFQWYGGIWRKMLGCFKLIFVQNQGSFEILKKSGLSQNALVNGDTRFDRVIEIAESSEELPPVFDEFCRAKKIIVAGSTWPEDEKVLSHYARIHPDIHFIIAPHEIHRENIKSIQKDFPGSILFSEWQSGKKYNGEHVLVVDNIGMLSRLYRLAHVTYIGGGFGNDGIHNILESAVYGKPVVFGPVYENFVEARDLVSLGGAFSVEHAVGLESVLDKLLADTKWLADCGKIAKDYVYERQGASTRVLSYVAENRLLTN